LGARTGKHHRWDSGVAGHSKATITANGSTGDILSTGTGYTGAGFKTYVVTITGDGDATTATFSWTATGGTGGSGSGVCGAAAPLNEGMQIKCSDEPAGTLGTCGAFFCTGDQWTVKVTDVASDPTGPNATTLKAGNGSRMPDGKAVCSTCHDQHSQTNLSHTTLSEAGNTLRHFMRITNDGGQLCFECHSDRFPNVADPNYPFDHTRTHTGGERSHPVGVALNQNLKNYDRAEPLDANGAPQSAGDGIASNNLYLTPAGQVACLTCHGMHAGAADGNSQSE